MDLLVTCACGHKMTVSEFAAGMTAPCPKCGQPLTVSPKNSKPYTREPESPINRAPTQSPEAASSGASHAEPIYTPLQTKSLKTHCVRCGREFRGDWDRHQSAIGLVCNICKNLIANDKQNLPTSGYVAPVDTMKLDPDLEVRPQEAIEIEEVEKTWREKYMPDEAMMRRIAIGAAIAFGLYTVWILISGAWVVGPSPEELEHTAATVDASQVPELPAWALVTIKVMSICSGFLSTFAGIYIFLTLSRRLPENTFLANAIQILPATAVIIAILFAVTVLAGPILGGILLMILIPCVVFINFGLEPQDFLNFPLGMILGGVLQGMCYLLIYWLIGSIAL